MLDEVNVKCGRCKKINVVSKESYDLIVDVGGLECEYCHRDFEVWSLSELAYRRWFLRDN